MLPVNSNAPKDNCPPVSSNCVIWDGPNISCISLCKGDSVTEVVYKLAEEVCAIQGEVGISELEFDCLLQVCNQTIDPPPSVTLPIILQLLIDGVCCINDIVENLPTPATPYVEPILNLPLCLQYVDPISGLPVTSLKLSDYAVATANKLCAINTIVNNHTTQINTLTTQVNTLINTPAAPLPTVTPVCVLPSSPTAMNTVLAALESQFCGLVTALGSNTQISAATASQCANLGAANALSTTGTMAGLPGWNTTVTNFAQAMQNLWITVCDMRAVVASVVDCCSQADCNNFILSFTASADITRNNVTVYFAPGSALPSGYSDCNPLGATVTISDGLGHTFTGAAILTTEVSNLTGITYNVSTASLNTSQVYTITVNGCVTDGVNSCSKVVTITLDPPCPVVSAVTATLT